MIRAEDISYSYRSRQEKMILEHFTFQFECGKLYAILGPSGAGKTTLLSLLAGLDVPTAGRILCDGQPLTERNLQLHRQKNVSLVFQSYNLIDYLTPRENVLLGGGGNPEELLESVGLGSEYWNRSVTQLSGGQQQRVAIARALGRGARILLADEPTGNLDAITAQEIIDLLKSAAHREGKCVIVVTHSRDLAAQADQTVMIQ